MAKTTEKAEKALTKSELLAKIADETNLTRKQVGDVFDSINKQIGASLGKSGCGKFVLPGLVKIEVKHVPAKPARKGVPNPFKPGETMDIPAKPASSKVLVRALKGLKELL